MNCQRCESGRVVQINAKCSDLCFTSVPINGGSMHNESDGYVPDDLGVGGGDYVEFSYCLECGQIQGKFPLQPSELEEYPECEACGVNDETVVPCRDKEGRTYIQDMKCCAKCQKDEDMVPIKGKF